MGKLDTPVRPLSERTLGPPRGRERRGGSVWIIGLLMYLLTAAALAPWPIRLPETEGRKSPVEIIAPEKISVPDAEATRAEIARLRERYPRYWIYDTKVEGEANDQILQTFNLLTQYSPESGADILRVSELLNERTRVRLSPTELERLYKEANLLQVKRNLQIIVGRMLDSRLIVANKALFNAQRKDSPDDMIFLDMPPDIQADPRNEDPLGWPEEALRYATSVELRSFYPSGEQRPLVEALGQILAAALGPNLEFDQARTIAERAAALRKIEETPVARVYAKGELIVAHNEIISPTAAQALARINEINWRFYPVRLLGVFLLTLTGFAAAAFYLGRLRNEVTFTPTNICLLALPGILAIVVGRALNLVPEIDAPVEAALFPSALVGMLVTIFLGAQSGFVTVLVTCLLYGAASELGVGYQIIWIFAGFTAVISLQSVRARKDLLVAGLRVGTVSFIMVCTLALFQAPFHLEPHILAWSLASGVFAAMLAWVLQEVFERVFGVVTDIRLLEITDPQNELLRQLEERAPATFEHVLNVTKLAESAAEDIGANFLLVRAGAYFHDVGKMLKPKYFSENQVSMEDKKAHSKLSPYMSVLIIKNHVKEGIEIARKHHLPPKIVDFIPQHHGTSLIRYFYAEALRRYESSESAEPVQEKDFRYPGPKPQSVETAIVMLADSVEATTTAVFTTSKVNENDLRRVVGQTITDKFNDGQFDECDLTMRDLSLLRESFVRTLKARYHQRITYPTLPKREPAPAGAAGS